MEKRKEDISIDHISMENLPDYGLDNNTKRIIEAHGEVSFIKKLGRLIKKHTRGSYNQKTGILNVTVAGITIFEFNFKKL